MATAAVTAVTTATTTISETLSPQSSPPSTPSNLLSSPEKSIAIDNVATETNSLSNSGSAAQLALSPVTGNETTDREEEEQPQKAATLSVLIGQRANKTGQLFEPVAMPPPPPDSPHAEPAPRKRRRKREDPQSCFANSEVSLFFVFGSFESRIVLLIPLVLLSLIHRNTIPMTRHRSHVRTSRVFRVKLCTIRTAVHT